MSKPTKKRAVPARARTQKAAKPRNETIEMPAPPKRGRPSAYDPAFCQRAIELGDQGKSRAQIARTLGISRQTLYRYMSQHPEFAEAMDESQFAALAYWEDIGQAGLSQPKFNAALYAFQMKSRFRAEYSEKVDVKHGMAADLDPEARELTDLDLARRVAFMLHEASQTVKRRKEQGLPVPAWQHGDVPN